MEMEHELSFIDDNGRIDYFTSPEPSSYADCIFAVYEFKNGMEFIRSYGTLYVPEDDPDLKLAMTVLWDVRAFWPSEFTEFMTPPDPRTGEMAHKIAVRFSTWETMNSLGSREFAHVLEFSFVDEEGYECGYEMDIPFGDVDRMSGDYQYV